MTPTFSNHGNLAPLCCLHYFWRVYTMIGLGSDKKTSDYSSGHQVLARVAIFIYVVLAPRSMWATWQAASTGKCTPSPPSNAQASTFSYFSHTHPPRACSTYLSLLVLIVHWLWVWAQVERVLLSHLMLVRAFSYYLSAHTYSPVGNVDVSGKWKCLVYEQSLHRAEKHHLVEHLTTRKCRSQRKQTMSRLQCASEHNLQKSFKVKK